MRRLVLLPVIGVALSLAFAAPASAQTAFQANGTSTQQKPNGPCPNAASGEYICGTADLAGYGAASWDFVVTSTTAVLTQCGSTYTATTSFTLASDPSSTLVVDESGNACAPGLDGNGYWKNNGYGHPFSFVGSWTVDPASTGQFAGLSGAGTDLINVAGAHLHGSYTGALGT
jgi:uncharacterized low-complexity protein